ncbi:HNH endonuclease signature motif containing protein [Streptomyces sp. NPDC014779]|uniref:HNH endonuclease signature motif containing protein n=1 Tax=Streptomyces sp. NPDC014779 TaxID=3364911 RepID=UPI0036FC551F
MNSPCSIAGCNRPVRARGWCVFHYNRWQRLGDPEPKGIRIHGDDEARFLTKVQKQEDGCWLWTGGLLTDSGYGRFAVERKPVIAHRWAYEHWVAPIPAGHQVDHLCRVVLCVRPEHLEAVTQEENRRRQAEAAGAIGRTCGLDGCERPYRSNGYCNTHYLRWKRGRPM